WRVRADAPMASRYNRPTSLEGKAMPTRVTVVGSINMDLVVSCERLPAAGETILGTDVQRFGGGKGANQALAAARMGARVTLIGKVGQDEAGQTLVGELLRSGVEIGRIGRAE